MIETRASEFPEKAEASIVSPQKRPAVLHVYSSLELGGGAEKLAYIFAKYYDSSRIDLLFLCLGEKGYFGEQIERLGIPVHSFHLHRGREFWKLPALLWSFVKKNRIDLIHTHLLEVDFFVRLFLVLHRKLRFVRTMHNVYMTSETGFDKLKLHQRLFYHGNFFLDNVSSGILFISKAVKSSFPNYRFKQDLKFRVLYNAFNEDDLKPTESPLAVKRMIGIEQNAFPVLCTMGRLAEQKGHSLLLHALQKLKDDFSNFKLIVIGDGPLRKRLQEQCLKLKILDNVIFMGKQKQIAKFLQLADIYIQPSLWEGFGITLIEAMAMGLPVITSDTGGMAEIVDDDYNGLLFRNKDYRELYKKIVILLNNKVLRENIARQAKVDVFQRYSGQKYSHNLTDVYLSLLKSSANWF